MIQWIKDLLGKNDYMEWKEFSSKLGNMEIEEFKQRVQEQNTRNIEFEG